MSQFCKVCSEPAAGFHFGAFTCEGCKSFFGRTYNNLSQIHECKNGGNCVINKQNRTSCKACRLKKCLVVGMSKSGSRYGRRSNWFKIHCALQDQAAVADEQSSIANNLHNSNSLLYSKISPDDKPRKNVLESLTDDISFSKHSSDSTTELYPFNSEYMSRENENQVKNTSIFQFKNASTVPALKEPSSFNYIQAVQLYRMLYPQLYESYLENIKGASCDGRNSSQPRDAMSSFPLSHSRPSSASSTSPLSSPAPSVGDRSYPATFQLQRAPSVSIHEDSFSSPPTFSPPILSRKRAADSAVQQDYPIDLSVKRFKGSPSVSVVELTSLVPSSVLSYASTIATSDLVCNAVDLTTKA